MDPSWNDRRTWQFLTIVGPITTDGPDVMAGECYFIAEPIYNEERLE